MTPRILCALALSATILSTGPVHADPAPQEIRLGVMLDLSEALADTGEGQQHMLALAERDIEAHFAATAQPMNLDLVVRDVGISPERALAAFDAMTAGG